MPGLHRHPIALLVALMLAGAAPVHATPDSLAATTEEQTRALQQSLREAAQQGAQGDTLGALIGFERLLAEPGLAKLPADDRTEAYVVAGWIALQLSQPAAARSYLASARQLAPEEPRALYLLGVLESEQGHHVEGARLITRSLRQADTFLPEVGFAMAGTQGQLLRGHDTEYRDFLQVLFDRNWKPDGVEPTDFWRLLAVLQLQSGQSDRVAATLERIDSPMEILALRADKRFDRYIDRNNPRFDPVQAAQRHLDALRVNALLAPDQPSALVHISQAMLVLGQHEEVLAVTEPMASAVASARVPPNIDDAGDIAWLLNNRAIAQRRLGDIDAALATLEAAAQFKQEGQTNISQWLNLAAWQAALLQPRKALETSARVGDNLSPYGEAVQQWVRFSAHRQLGDTEQADRAKAWLKDHADNADGYVLETLLYDNALDQAAADLIARLHSTETRSDALLSVQRLRTVPPLPGDVEQERRWWQVVDRADVQAALKAVGRSEQHALFRPGG